MCYKKTGENTFHNKMTHETFGTVEWTETFCDEGYKVVSLFQSFIFVLNYTTFPDNKIV